MATYFKFPDQDSYSLASHRIYNYSVTRTSKLKVVLRFCDFALSFSCGPSASGCTLILRWRKFFCRWHFPRCFRWMFIITAAQRSHMTRTLRSLWSCTLRNALFAPVPRKFIEKSFREGTEPFVHSSSLPTASAIATLPFLFSSFFFSFFSFFLLFKTDCDCLRNSRPTFLRLLCFASLRFFECDRKSVYLVCIGFRENILCTGMGILSMKLLILAILCIGDIWRSLHFWYFRLTVFLFI